MILAQFIHIFLLFMLQKEHFGICGVGGQCSSPLGLEDRSIPDPDITASSEVSIYYGPRLGRLNNVESGSDQGGWCGLVKLGDWIQVNLRKIAKVTAIATQGRQDYPQWVKTYKICYGQKLDGYCELLDQEHFGICGVGGQCSSPLGLEDRSIPDPDITASSEVSIYYGPRLGRLNNVESGSDQGGWCGLVKLGDWIQVNLRKIAKVTAIATQGRQDYPQWVKTYKICYGQKLDGYCELLDQSLIFTSKNYIEIVTRLRLSKHS
ncbi:lactadherin-like [Orbicella faveolata]|uniref:lactadherin-like n=1 Tax=Orbicella faveolata TaxID=48498 RepID=UPI0009E62990|nr:lactadherin-like [Orbicella faveolata]